MKSILCRRALLALFALAALLGGCAAARGDDAPRRYTVVVEGNDTSGRVVRIQSRNDSAPRVVPVPFVEQWEWGYGCHRAVFQRTALSAEDPGELLVTFKFGGNQTMVRKTMLLMGVIDVSLCFEENLFFSE